MTAGPYVYANPYTGRAGSSDYRSVTFTVPNGWEADGNLVYKGDDPRQRVALGIWTIGSLYEDPCRWQTSALNRLRTGHIHLPDGSMSLEPGGPFDRQPREPSGAAEIELAGESTLRFQLSLQPDFNVSSCDNGEYRAWLDAGEKANSNHAAGQTDVIYMVDVDRAPIVIDASYMPDTASSDQNELWEVIDSIEIDR